MAKKAKITVRKFSSRTEDRSCILCEKSSYTVQLYTIKMDWVTLTLCGKCMRNLGEKMVAVAPVK